MSECMAWLLHLPGGPRAAVGELEMVHVVPSSPALFEIPLSPFYCRNVVVWRDEVLPLMNLAARVTGEAVAQTETIAGIENLVGIVAYQSCSDGAPRKGALVLGGAPARIRVSDVQACALPASEQGWRPITISCFKHPDHGPVPVLDLPAVFG